MDGSIIDLGSLLLLVLSTCKVLTWIFRFDESTKDDILVFVLNHALGLPSYAKVGVSQVLLHCSLSSFLILVQRALVLSYH